MGITYRTEPDPSALLAGINVQSLSSNALFAYRAQVSVWPFLLVSLPLATRWTSRLELRRRSPHRFGVVRRDYTDLHFTLVDREHLVAVRYADERMADRHYLEREPVEDCRLLRVSEHRFSFVLQPRYRYVAVKLQVVRLYRFGATHGTVLSL